MATIYNLQSISDISYRAKGKIGAREASCHPTIF